MGIRLTRPTSRRSTTRARALVLATSLLACSLPAASTSHAATAPGFGFAPLAGATFTAPVWVGAAGDGRATLYVVEQRGLVWTLANGRRSRFLDLRDDVSTGGEQGLLSIAFGPGSNADERRLYAYFTRRDGNGQVRQYLLRDGSVVQGSGRDVITVKLDDPAATNHNGGTLWTTTSGLLYLSTGDGGGGGDPAGNAQRLDRLAGKLLRITPRARGGYLIPRSNPFADRRGARGEIYALGLRNPFRFSIDGPTGDIWIGDVGQDAREEIDRLPGGQPAGANFGWPRTEGTRLFDADTRLTAGTRVAAPFIDYGRAGGECSVTGGLVYRGPVRVLRGRYLYADFCTDRLVALDPRTRRRTSRAGVPGIVHFGAGRGGDVYAASLQTGRIYRVVDR